MGPQSTCIRGCKVTLIAFVWLFSTVFFQMSHQMAWLRGCIITLVAFVWLFSSVCFQMSLQMARVSGYIHALVAFVHLFDIVSLFHWDFHICIFSAHVLISNSFFHFHSVHFVVLLQMVTSWHWSKSEGLEDTKTGGGKEKVKSDVKLIRCLEYQKFFSPSIFLGHQYTVCVKCCKAKFCLQHQI